MAGSTDRAKILTAMPSTTAAKPTCWRDFERGRAEAVARRRAQHRLRTRRWLMRTDPTLPNLLVR